MSYISAFTYDHMLLHGPYRNDIVGIQPPAKRPKIINNLDNKDDYSPQFLRSAITPLSDYKIIDKKRDDHQAESGQESEGGSRGVFLTDSFTSDEIKRHLCSLNGGSNGNDFGGENTCQLCDKDCLMFATPPMDCASCLRRIRTGSICYKAGDESGVRYSFCANCFNRARGGRILAGVRSFPKESLVKGKNVGKGEEGWVQCDRCHRWQHQICALYNSEHDVGGKMTYICPICRLSELDREVNNVPVTPILGARDLPRTEVSDHIEERLFKYLALERLYRATFYGKPFPEEVPGAEDLVVRTVLAVDKRVKVKQQFLDIFHGESYPSEFPYNSKVIMLFQKIDGADVCLFAMCVQEFGTECGEPNQRSVYISYIDSVKYFTPDIKAFTGQALRTFVYHEILMGYLDYCKQRGFNTCYIWACPPSRGDDYILHCHLETQRTPKPEKLRKWYKTLLNEAMADGIVAEYTNFYDYFFVPKYQNDKITAARLPYFDGDYWTGTIENMIETMEKNCTVKSKQPKKSMSKRKCKAMGHNGISLDAATDIQVMTKLGDTILPVKEDFFVVRLQFTCVSCREAILCGSRWSCDKCRNFHLCNRCLEFEQSHEGLVTHATHRGENHELNRITVSDVASSTKDKDVTINNEIFENRRAFLNFCQRKNFQFDSLRRAKHSTMMVLYHVHKDKRIQNAV